MKNNEGRHPGRKSLAVILTLALAGAMFLGGTVTTFAASTFSDLRGTLYEDEVESLVDLGIINGYPDGTFRPGNNITRAEVCTVVTKAMSPGSSKMTDAVDSGFPDVTTTSAWAEAYINYATAMGVITGYTDGTFRPSNNVTYNELSAMLIRGMGIKESELTGKWPENYKTKAKSLGIYDKIMDRLTTQQQASFNYNAQATRGDAVLMISAVVDQLKEQGKTSLPEGKSRSHIYEDGRYEWIDGDATNLSIKKAVELMQTEGVLAETAKSNLASDQAVLAGYESSATELRAIIDLIDQIEKIEDSLKDGEKLSDEDLTSIKSNLRTVIKSLISESGTTSSSLSLSSLTSLSGITFDDIWPEDQEITSPQDLLDRIESLKNKSKVNLTDLRSTLVFYTEMAEAQRDFCKNNIEANNQAELNSIESQTIALYYGVLQARENLLVCEDNLDAQNTIMNNVNLKYKAGTAAAIEVKSQRAAVLSAEQTVKEAKAALEEASMSFNMLLGYEVTDNISLTDGLTVLTFPEKDVKDYIDMALENRLTYKQVSFGVDMAKKYMAFEGKKSVESETYSQLQDSYRSLNSTMYTLKQNIELEVRTAYIELLNKYDAIQNAIETLKLSQESLKIKKLMYENGLATLSDVQQAQVVVFQTNQLIMSKTADYNTAVYNFGYITGVGTERISFQQEQ